jgi:transcription elongation GreA/GreB family factor
MTDGKGFKRIVNGDLEIKEDYQEVIQARSSIIDSMPRRLIDEFIEDKRNEDEARRMKNIIKSCINTGKLITRTKYDTNRFRVVNIGSVVSYDYNSEDKTINLMTVDYRNGFPKNIIYTGEFREIDGTTYIHLLSASSKPSIHNRGLIEIEV